MSDVDIDLVVINYKTYGLLQEFINSYFDFKPQCSSTLTVIDVESDKASFEAINAPGCTMIAYEDNIGYSAACNAGASVTSGRNVAFFNADTRFINHDCVDYCVDYMETHAKVGIVGPLQYDDEKKCTHGGIFGKLSAPMHRGWGSNMISNMRNNKKAVTVSGSAYFVKRKVWDELANCEIYKAQHPEAQGAFLPTPHYFEETWCSYHAQAHDYEVWYLGLAEMIHHWHKASPKGGYADKMFPISKEIFVAMCEAHGIEHD